MAYRWRFGDENVVANLRQRWPEECATFTDLQLAHLYSEFNVSDESGNNDEKFPIWLADGPIPD